MMILRCPATGQDYHRVIKEYCLDCHQHMPPLSTMSTGALDPNSLISPPQWRVLWHPHTDPPGEAENALIAVMRPRVTGDESLFLIGLAEAKHGRWVSEDWAEPIAPPYWWADEAELIALIPQAEKPEAEPCNHVWHPPAYANGEWHCGPIFCMRCGAQAVRTVELSPLKDKAPDVRG